MLLLIIIETVQSYECVICSFFCFPVKIHCLLLLIGLLAFVHRVASCHIAACWQTPHGKSSSHTVHLSEYVAPLTLKKIHSIYCNNFYYYYYYHCWYSQYLYFILLRWHDEMNITAVLLTSHGTHPSQIIHSVVMWVTLIYAMCSVSWVIYRDVQVWLWSLHVQEYLPHFTIFIAVTFLLATSAVTNTITITATAVFVDLHPYHSYCYSLPCFLFYHG